MKPKETTKCPHYKGQPKHKHYVAAQIYFNNEQNMVFVVTTSGSIFWNVLNLTLGSNPPPWKKYEGPWECVFDEDGELIP